MSFIKNRKMIGMFFGTLFFAALLVGLGVLVGFLIPSGESTGKYHDGFLDCVTHSVLNLSAGSGPLGDQ